MPRFLVVGHSESDSSVPHNSPPPPPPLPTTHTSPLPILTPTPTLIPALPPACCPCHVANRAAAPPPALLAGSVGLSVRRSLGAQLILDRAAPTLVRTLENGQGTGVLKETSTIAVASMAKMFVGDIVEEGKKDRRTIMYTFIYTWKVNRYFVRILLVVRVACRWFAFRGLVVSL